MTRPTLASVTAWTLIEAPGYRGKIPAMPAEERAALAELEQLARPFTHEEAALRSALRRKLQARASREEDPL